MNRELGGIIDGFFVITRLGASAKETSAKTISMIEFDGKT
jgi:hypothetical protein